MYFVARVILPFTDENYWAPGNKKSQIFSFFTDANNIYPRT
jgi:hypothetical protein